MKRDYLIETEDFAGSQMTQEGFPRTVKDLTPYLGSPPVAYFDREGMVTHLANAETWERIISLGQHYSMTEDSYNVHETPLELISYYESLHGVVPGDSVEDKLGNITFAYFKKHLTTISLDELMASLEEEGEEAESTWSVTNFPWGMDKKSLLERSLRGFSDVDWYNFNFYFARVLRDMALKFIDDGHGFAELVPGNPSASHALWEEKLRTMAAGFQHFIDQDEFLDDYEYEPQRAKEALAIFVELFENLWD